MDRILSEITTIANHLSVMRNDPEVYCPKRCPDCGFGKLWGTGVTSARRIAVKAP